MARTIYIKWLDRFDYCLYYNPFPLEKVNREEEKREAWKKS
jgi:hypothetical protein